MTSLRLEALTGHVLTLKAEIIRFRKNFGKAHGIDSVDGEVAAEGDLSFAIAKES